MKTVCKTLFTKKNCVYFELKTGTISGMKTKLMFPVKQYFFFAVFRFIIFFQDHFWPSQIVL